MMNPMTAGSGKAAKVRLMDENVTRWFLVAALAVSTLALGALVAAALRPGIDEGSPTVNARVVGLSERGTRWIDVEYAGPAGKVRTRTTHFSGQDFELGRVVKIRYDRSDPERVEVVGAADGRIDRWIFASVFGVADVVLLVLVVRSFRRRRIAG